MWITKGGGVSGRKQILERVEKKFLHQGFSLEGCEIPDSKGNMGYTSGKEDLGRILNARRGEKKRIILQKKRFV